MSKANKQEQFEAAVKRVAIEHFGYSDGDALLKNILEKRKNGSYCVEWVNGFAIGWQASREAVVVKLPINVSGGLYSLALEDCKRCIEAQGLKVAP